MAWAPTAEMFGGYGGAGTAARAKDPAFLYTDALSSDDGDDDMGEVEADLHETSYVEVDQSLYTNALLSVMSSADNCMTILTSFLLLVAVAVLQYVLIMAIVSHVRIAMSWTVWSVKKQATVGLYSGLLNDGRLNYLRLDKEQVVDLCGTFDYEIQEKSLPGTNWSAYFQYSKAPVSSWQPQDIPPTDRSQLDVARFVLENEFFILVYTIVTFVWILSAFNEFRGIVQFFLAVWQMPLADRIGEVLRRDGDDLDILGMTRLGKTVGFLITLYRIGMTTLIAGVGAMFLLWTTTDIDLILNALALTFILELDHITYNATVYAPRREVMSNLKRLKWSHPVWCSYRCPNTHIVGMMCFVIFGSGLTTYWLRMHQVAKYMNMFTLTTSICLFQGPTPGYWSRFHATFPAPGLCESILGLRCESPIVGELGKPCVEDWTQRLCKFYVETGSMFNTWNDIDWKNQGACLAKVKGTLHNVRDARFAHPQSTFNIIAQTCQAMWQQRPTVIFEGNQREFTGPRVRVFPYMDFFLAGPFWCQYKGGSEHVLRANAPAPLSKWAKHLSTCGSSLLTYSTKSATNWVETEQNADVSKLENATEERSFSGIWLSKRLGVFVISAEGTQASVSNTNLPSSPVSAVVDGNTITIMVSPPWHGNLSDNGRIELDNGDTLVSQRTAVEEEKQHEERKFFFR